MLQNRVKLSGAYTTWHTPQGVHFFDLHSELYIGALWEDTLSISKTYSFSSRDRFQFWNKQRLTILDNGLANIEGGQNIRLSRQRKGLLKAKLFQGSGFGKAGHDWAIDYDNSYYNTMEDNGKLIISAQRRLISVNDQQFTFKLGGKVSVGVSVTITALPWETEAAYVGNSDQMSWLINASGATALVASTVLIPLLLY